VKVVDTSVAIAAFASWHELHRPAAAVLRAKPALAAQSALETYSVLTRLPPPHRAAPAIVQEFLAASFPDPYVGLAPEGVAALIPELAELGIVGGATYDALIGAVARGVGATLITCDLRARQTYERIGVPVEYLIAG
jgi:predicted nucleic acid-binding protein